ncbi:MAG: hypothetical protein ISQ13_03970 [Candidatus Margulisbacteria bacterium]|nr:hypothetical protein [Candidatus Margulisiibacteriota bacterium]
MKLRGANLLELSLSIAFALVVFAISLQLVQESTDRINKGFSFKSFQAISFQTLLRLHHLSDWNFSDEHAPFSLMDLNFYEDASLLRTDYSFTNQQWATATTNPDVTKIEIQHESFHHSLSSYYSNYASIDQLTACLMTIKLALLTYYNMNQFYPPSHQLNYLTQSAIITKLPNNPYTNEDLSTSDNKNVTDWHYTNTNGTITLFAYTHPSRMIQF